MQIGMESLSGNKDIIHKRHPIDLGLPYTGNINHQQLLSLLTPELPITTH